MDKEGIIPHLFRTEYRKIVSVLCRRFGFDQIEIAEDIVSETFMTATQSWGINGNPANPTAWLYYVAKSKAKNYLQRRSLFESKISPEIKQSSAGHLEEEIDLSDQNIFDSQLQMMFAICHPSISPGAQVGLALRILCGFGIEEIADAFLTSKETINKRLFRAKEKLREGNINVELPPSSEIEERLESIMMTIYLLFNEGYYSASQDKTLRKELCFEAMRLCTMLIENMDTNTPSVNALLSLMCFHASRFEARVNESGELVLYEEQQTELWNTDLISKGVYFLSRSSTGNKLSKYHLEAGIAYWHTIKQDTREKWEHVLELYDELLRLEYSPVTALNRAYALSKTNSKREAISEVTKLNLSDYYLYHALLGELYTGVDREMAKEHLKIAMRLTKSESDRRVLTDKLEML